MHTPFSILRTTILIGGVLIAPHMVQAETVPATNFQLYDARGHVSAELTTSAEGTPAFFIYDMRGVPRISIGLYQDGAPGIVLNDEKGLAAAILRLVQSNGQPVLVLKEDGSDRLIIREDTPIGSSSGSPELWILTGIVGFLAGLLGAFVFQKTRRTSIDVT